MTVNFLLKQIFFTICLSALLSGCGGGGSSTTDESTSVTNEDTAPTVTLSVTPTLVNYNGSTTLSWQTSNVDSCIATGDWFGDKPISGSVILDNITLDSTYTLDCTGPEGTTSKSVSITVVAGSTGNLRGSVDSSYIDRDGINAVYLYQGAVVPDDIDGDAGDPLTVAQVVQGNGGCGWNYDFPALSPGEYTIAFTNQSALDDSQQNDTIAFVGVSTLTIASGLNGKDFRPANILRVGPGKAYTTPSEAAKVANDGDVIEIDAGEYLDDIVVWRRNGLVLRGVGGRAHMRATKIIPYTSGNDRENGMGIWVTRGSNITVENIEFSGSKVPDLNGAGIRVIGPGLTVCNSYFHDNENGILGGAGTLTIEFSEFNNNGLGDYGRTHNIYVDGGSKLIFRHNYSHHAYIGHNLKSRASENYILYNRIMDEVNGQSSYAIDVPNGGLTYIIGNLLQQGTGSDNSTMVAYGAEGLRSGRTHNLYVVNNTLVNDLGSGKFLGISSAAGTVKIVNNIFVGGGTLKSGPGEMTTNLETDTPGFIDRDSFNYDINDTSSARNAGSGPGLGDGMDLVPEFQYRHVAERENRATNGTIDIGAYEH
jgi:hypothetical protein